MDLDTSLLWSESGRKSCFENAVDIKMTLFVIPKDGAAEAA